MENIDIDTTHIIDNDFNFILILALKSILK